MTNLRTTKLHEGNTVSSGQPFELPSGNCLFQAWMTGAGSAKCNVYTRISTAGPWRWAGTMTVSAAVPNDQFKLDGENWAHAYAEITEISGGANVTVEMRG